jgi:alpha-L-fucosidase
MHISLLHIFNFIFHRTGFLIFEAEKQIESITMQKYKLVFIHIFSLTLLFASVLPSCSKKEAQKTTTTSTDVPTQKSTEDILTHWEKDKLSLFIHFGVYSELEGKWNNKKIEGSSEDIWGNAGLFLEDYERTARTFNPNKWDANEIVNLARDIGMKTIILSAKHHDGFCLFDTETTDFNSVKFTPLNKDLVASMASACKNGKINFGISFSLTDWHLPAAFPMSKYRGNPVSDEHHKINLQQIRELLTNYGPVSEIYFHSGLNTPAQSSELKDLINELQPECLVSNGIGNNFGDFIATEWNKKPEVELNSPWIMRSSLLPSSLGYLPEVKNIDQLETARTKVRELTDVISKGGNYALNIGPKGDGSLPETETEILRHIGRWIKVNREAITGTYKTPFASPSKYWKITQKANKLFLFVNSVPTNQTIQLSGFKNKIQSVSFLGSGIEPTFEQSGERYTINWTSPAMADPMQMPVLRIIFQDSIHAITAPHLKISQNDTVSLDLQNCIRLKSITGRDRLSSIPSTTSLLWNIDAEHEQTATLRFTPQQQGRILMLETSGKRMEVTLKGKQRELIRSENDTIQTGTIFKSIPFYGALDEVQINPAGQDRLQVSNSSWMGINKNKKDPYALLPLSTVYYYTDIESENDQQYCYQIIGNDGLQVWFNKKELLLTENPATGNPMKKELVLNLKEGKNILLVKNFNRMGAGDYFDLIPEPDAKWLTQEIPISANPGFIKITDAARTSKYNDIDLSNFSITLVPKK